MIDETEKEEQGTAQASSAEMSAEDLKQVVGGGTQEIAINKAKAAGKATSSMESYIKG